MAKGRDMFSEFYVDFHESGVRDGSGYIKKMLGPSGQFNEKVEWRQISTDRVERLEFGSSNGRKFLLKNTFDFLAETHLSVRALESGVVMSRYDSFADTDRKAINDARKWLGSRP